MIYYEQIINFDISILSFSKLIQRDFLLFMLFLILYLLVA